jgi:hypothetical protein
MQEELVSERPELPIQIIGVNEIGYESGNEEICEAVDLPWLQDDKKTLVWDSWGVTYRDVWILDGDNVPYAIYNLTTHSLADEANYEELKALFIAAAEDL